MIHADVITVWRSLWLMVMMLLVLIMLLQSDHSSSYLRAARAGNLDKLLDLLQSGKANINTTNAVCTLLHFYWQ